MCECVAEECQTTEDDPGADQGRGDDGDQAPEQRPLHESRFESLDDPVHGDPLSAAQGGDDPLGVGADHVDVGRTVGILVAERLGEQLDDLDVPDLVGKGLGQLVRR